jgi:hypothetical protein
VRDDGVEDEEAWSGLSMTEKGVNGVILRLVILLGRIFSYNIFLDERRPHATHEGQLVHARGHWGTAVVNNANYTPIVPSCLAVGFDPGRPAGAGLRATRGVGVDHDVFADVE